MMGPMAQGTQFQLTWVSTRPGAEFDVYECSFYEPVGDDFLTEAPFTLHAWIQ